MLKSLLHMGIQLFCMHQSKGGGAAHFKMVKERLEDDDRCRRPTTATTEENISHILMGKESGPSCSKHR